MGPRHVNRLSVGPISPKPSWASTSLKHADPGSLPSALFGRSAAANVTLKSPPMSVGRFGKAPHSCIKSSHNSPRTVGIVGPYADANTRWIPSAHRRRCAATTCRPRYSANLSNEISFHATITPPERHVALIQTCESLHPHPRSDHIRWSVSISKVSCKHMTSTPHSLR